MQTTFTPDTLRKKTIAIEMSGIRVRNDATALADGNQDGTGAPCGMPHQGENRMNDQNANAAK